MPQQAAGTRPTGHISEKRPAYTVRNIESDKAVFFGQLDEIALLVVGDGDDVLRPIRANLRFERFGHNQILAHRLRRSAGFADDAEARFTVR